MTTSSVDEDLEGLELSHLLMDLTGDLPQLHKKVNMYIWVNIASLSHTHTTFTYLLKVSIHTCVHSTFTCSNSSHLKATNRNTLECNKDIE